MSHIEVFYCVRGDGFDAPAFTQLLPDHLKGEIRPLRTWRTGMPLPRKLFWVSLAKQVGALATGYDEDIRELLTAYTPFFSLLDPEAEKSITLCTVVHYDGCEDVHGFWLSPETIKLLACYHIGVDIDAYGYQALR